MLTNPRAKRFLNGLMMLALLAVFLGMGTSAAHAQSLSGPSHSVAQASVIACHQSISGSHSTLCNAPQVNITCGGNIGSTNDFNGVPINWTFNTHQPGPVCVTATYNLGFTNPNEINCSFSFYVPNGDATGDIIFQFTNSSGTFTSELNENPVSGWTTILGGDQTGVTRLSFTDVNDQPTNSVRLGWGRTTSFSLQRVCG